MGPVSLPLWWNRCALRMMMTSTDGWYNVSIQPWGCLQLTWQVQGTFLVRPIARCKCNTRQLRTWVQSSVAALWQQYKPLPRQRHEPRQQGQQMTTKAEKVHSPRMMSPPSWALRMLHPPPSNSYHSGAAYRHPKSHAEIQRTHSAISSWRT
jgi:hypothetical protein